MAILFASWVQAQFGTNFEVEARVAPDSPEMLIKLDIPRKAYVYAESWEVTASGEALAPLTPLPAIHALDAITGEYQDLILSNMVIRYPLPGEGAVVDVALQGCYENICYPPENHLFKRVGDRLLPHEEESEAAATLTADTDWLMGLRIASTAAGYMKPEPFLDFLAGGEGGGKGQTLSGFTAFTTDPAGFLAERGWWFTVLLILVGGLLLNLTPCILPMIPINLAIIGAGAQDGARSRGFMLGGVYGLGMALAYGALGLSVVLTKGFFGSLQSHPVFNIVIAIVFVVLALALFDVFSIDFTRFQKSGGSSGAGIGVVLSLGAMSALLAGACVAPVVLAVLLLAGKLYAEGAHGALSLPFLLGIGMALPWPLAGAGLAVLPKPGNWMRYVKGAFGVVILLMALYYAYLAWIGISPKAEPDGSIAAGDQAAWVERLSEARKTGKPVLLDYWATWCKNCSAMNSTTLKDDRVVEALKEYVLIPVQAERPGEEPAKSHLRAMGVSGLPSYVILRP